LQFFLFIFLKTRHTSYTAIPATATPPQWYYKRVPSIIEPIILSQIEALSIKYFDLASAKSDDYTYHLGKRLYLGARCEGLPGVYSTIWCLCYKTNKLKKKRNRRRGAGPVYIG
jgi:hypothetical protein